MFGEFFFVPLQLSFTAFSPLGCYVIYCFVLACPAGFLPLGTTALLSALCGALMPGGIGQSLSLKKEKCLTLRKRGLSSLICIRGSLVLGFGLVADAAIFLADAPGRISCVHVRLASLILVVQCPCNFSRFLFWVVFLVSIFSNIFCRVAMGVRMPSLFVADVLL